MDTRHYKNHKNKSIRNWKKRGVISDDFNKLYEKYININNCEICNIEFNKDIRNQHRCLDHDHRTGLYRQTICHKCNKDYDRQPNIFKGNKLNHQYINIWKRKSYNGLRPQAYFRYARIIKNKNVKIQKRNISLTKLIAFSFIQILKYDK